MTSCLDKIKKTIVSNKHQWLEDYFKFLSIPSVSSEPEYKKQVQECADWVTGFLKESGFTVEQWKTSGHPTVFAQNLSAGPNKPTLLIYNHYDVQPPDPLEEWKSPPFQPTKREDEIYARGAQDNKGQCFYVIQALKYYFKEFGSFPINIKLCIEGEEEMGSAGLSAILKDRKKELQADFIAIVDLGIRDPKVPAITLGLRGLVTMELELKSSNGDLHSGSHGGLAVNPIHKLTKLLSSIHDEKGRVVIPGFYDQCREVPLEEISRVSFNFDASEYQKNTGSYPLGGEKDYPALERVWLRPTFEVNGIWGGYTGKGFKTVIPAKAFAKISCRLVPDQIPQEVGELVASFLQNNAPQGCEVKVTVHPGGGKAVRVSSTDRVALAFSQAFQEVFEVPCEFILNGASIPIVTELAEVSGGEVILIGLGLSGDKIHAPNEHFGIDRLEKGMLIIARAIEVLAGK